MRCTFVLGGSSLAFVSIEKERDESLEDLDKPVMGKNAAARLFGTICFRRESSHKGDDGSRPENLRGQPNQYTEAPGYCQDLHR